MNPRSVASLVGVHPALVQVVQRAFENGPIKFTVIEGLRTPQRQSDLYAQGRSKPGNIVTWTMRSKHLKQTTGFGEAVDLANIERGQVIWSDCDKIAAQMMAAAKQMNVPITWGADWDRDGKPREKGETDSPHFQLGPMP